MLKLMDPVCNYLTGIMDSFKANDLESFWKHQCMRDSVNSNELDGICAEYVFPLVKEWDPGAIRPGMCQSHMLRV